ncbi:hypothetical protein L7F22_051716 [Adiantum nelumboides]|nr:hypothetical protein [Adiantum nelumboides]
MMSLRAKDVGPVVLGKAALMAAGARAGDGGQLWGREPTNEESVALVVIDQGGAQCDRRRWRAGQMLHLDSRHKLHPTAALAGAARSSAEMRRRRCEEERKNCSPGGDGELGQMLQLDSTPYRSARGRRSWRPLLSQNAPAALRGRKKELQPNTAKTKRKVGKIGNAGFRTLYILHVKQVLYQCQALMAPAAQPKCAGGAARKKERTAAQHGQDQREEGKIGNAGFRTLYILHVKQVLYQLSYIP